MSIPTSLLVISDRAASGERKDETAGALRIPLESAGFQLVAVDVVPDEREAIAKAIRNAAAVTDLVLTTGGTGISDRDVTPEATRDVLEYEIPGLGETMRNRSLAKTVHAMGSRALAGVLGRAVVVNLPGRPQGAVDCFGYVAPALPHLVAVRRGPVTDESHEAR